MDYCLAIFGRQCDICYTFFAVRLVVIIIRWTFSLIRILGSFLWGNPQRIMLELAFVTKFTCSGFHKEIADLLYIVGFFMYLILLKNTI